MRLFAIIGPIIGAAAPLSTQSVALDADVERLLAPAREEYAQYAAGIVSVEARAITRTDITGNGVPDLFVDEQFITCSTVAAFRSGTGGWVLHVQAESKTQEWRVLG